jgi:hypothetical protein
VNASSDVGHMGHVLSITTPPDDPLHWQIAFGQSH